MTTAISQGALFSVKASSAAPLAVAAAAVLDASKPQGLLKIEIQALSQDVVARPKKDAAVEKMVELLEQMLYNSVKVNDELLPVWTGVKVKSRGYLIYLEIPGPKRLKFKQDATGKWAVEKKDGVDQYTRKTGLKIPLMNAKDFIPLTATNHKESQRLVERTFKTLPYITGMLDLVLNRTSELNGEVERRLGITA